MAKQQPLVSDEQWRQFLLPGDILLYDSSGFVSWWIKFKTWDDTSHAEVYLGEGKSAGSRGPSEGINTYDLRTEDLAYVLRPNVPFDLARMEAFHNSCIGQGYDLWGLIKVFYLNKQGDTNKAYCSEHVARMCREENGGPGLFNPKVDCDEVTPGMLKCSPRVDLWSVKDVQAVAQEARALAA